MKYARIDHLELLIEITCSHDVFEKAVRQRLKDAGFDTGRRYSEYSDAVDSEYTKTYSQDLD